MERINLSLASLDDLDDLMRVGDALFDNPVTPELASAFFRGDHNLLAVAWHANKIVGMASGLIYVHPDKGPAMFINEVAVLEDFRNNGIGRGLVQFLWRLGRERGCSEAWLATEESNVAARRSYIGAGGIEEAEKASVFIFKD